MLQSMGSQGVGHELATEQQQLHKIMDNYKVISMEII